MEVSPQSSKGEGTLTPAKPRPVFHERHSEGKDEAMVSSAIAPLTAQVEVEGAPVGSKGSLYRLVRLWVQLLLCQPANNGVVGLKLKRLKQPMKFEQVDGSLTEGVPATCLTEPVSLRVGSHKETIQFIVAPKMAENRIDIGWQHQYS